MQWWNIEFLPEWCEAGHWAGLFLLRHHRPHQHFHMNNEHILIFQTLLQQKYRNVFALDSFKPKYQQSLTLKMFGWIEKVSDTGQPRADLFLFLICWQNLTYLDERQMERRECFQGWKTQARHRLWLQGWIHRYGFRGKGKCYDISHERHTADAMRGDMQSNAVRDDRQKKLHQSWDANCKCTRVSTRS